MKRGIDVSHHQRAVNKDVLSNNPPDFFVSRSSYIGSDTKMFVADRRFAQNAPLLKGVAVRGVYHYYSSHRDWLYQADNFINLIKGHDFDFFAVDMERTNNQPDKAFALGAIKFLKKVEEVLGIPGLIYTNQSIYQSYLRPHSAEYDDLPLWIASFANTPSMPVTRDADDWDIWQYSETGAASKWGFQGNSAGHIDLDNMKDAFYKKFKPQTPDIAELYIEALNTHSSNEVAELYTHNAVHITPKRTIQGKTNIRNWYLLIFNQIPNATFQLKGSSGVGGSRHISWEVKYSNGNSKIINDTLGLVNGKIAYHFSRFIIAGAEKPKYTVDVNSMNIHSEASIDSQVIGALRKNDVVTLLEKSEDLYWYKIETPESIIGWVAHKKLANVPGDESADDEIQNNDPPWLKIAQQEMGVKEYAGSADNPRIVAYHKSTTLPERYANQDETPWCASFVNWCIEKSGYEGTDSARARDWEHWGKKLDTPRKGCIVVFKRPPSPTSGHVGFYIDESESKIRVLGGNQGHEVNISGQDKGNFLSYRWPVHYEQ